MTDKIELLDKVNQLNETAMAYETAVTPFFEEDYLKEFYDFYEIRNRELLLIPSEEDFDGSLRNVSGGYRWEAIAAKTKSLFGLPFRIRVFDDEECEDLREELGGCEGLSPFFFVFDMMFCEYEGFTLCFMSGTNN